MKNFLTSVLVTFLFLSNVASAEFQINRAELIRYALNVQANSYAPYANFNVAAA